MELVEREEFLAQLHRLFQKASKGDGHTVFIAGEAGIGKSSLVKAFSRDHNDHTLVYQGACDALFTPRPLAPLYDILWEISDQDWPEHPSIEERSALFTGFFRELSAKNQRSIIIFEDIHWADEATLDFIRFFSRRLPQLRCLFILTYRDNEIPSNHPLRNIMGQLSPDIFSRMTLTPLSREAVQRMADQRGYSGEDVYHISGGNPFYVNEILASYSLGIPENIKDAVLASFNQQEGLTKQLWELFSVIPTSIETGYLSILEPHYAQAIEECLVSKILVEKEGAIGFKHELFRRTIETSLSPLKRVALHKQVLQFLEVSFKENNEIERIIHHAKNANDYERVNHYAPLAARTAAKMGAHTEAARLYLTAIEYYQGKDAGVLVNYYESYAYECYLISELKEAIIYTNKALTIWKAQDNKEQVGKNLRFLSRVWWYDGHGKNAERYAREAIEILADQPASKTKAMAYSNMSQLSMLADRQDECLEWGNKAIGMARDLDDGETLAHALNNVGTIRSRENSTEGTDLLQQSLALSLSNGFHEHASRAYTNLAGGSVDAKNYVFAAKILEEGIQYCEDRDLDSWRNYMTAYKSRLLLETGNYNEAAHLSGSILGQEGIPGITRIVALLVATTIKMRKGETGITELFEEAKSKAFATSEAQRILPVASLLLEYEWLTGTPVISREEINTAIQLATTTVNHFENAKLDYWLSKAKGMETNIPVSFDGYKPGNYKTAIQYWKKTGCPYEQALLLYEGSETDKRESLDILQKLGTGAVYEKLKQEMRISGIKKIPRGMRASTRANPAQLTLRELEILPLLKEGLQNKEIAARLYISPKTVDHHISSLFLKLDVNTRAKAVAEAARLGILK